MTIEIKAPAFPESVSEGTVATWHKQPGEAVARDELIVDIETDKVVMEVVAPADGQVVEILKNEGDVVLSSEVIAQFAKGNGAAAVNAKPAAAGEAKTEPTASPAARKLIDENGLQAAQIDATGKGGRITKEDVLNHLKNAPATSQEAAPVATGDKVDIKAPDFPESVSEGTVASWHKQPGEAVSRDDVIVDIETDKVVLEVVAPADGQVTEVLKKEGDTVQSGEVVGKFTKGAVAATVSAPVQTQVKEETAAPREVVAPAPAPTPAAPAPVPGPELSGERVEKRVPMTRLRATIASRLVQAQQTAAMLTTYNEVNMQPVMELRSKYKADFEKAHDGTRLGFMSFFVKAAVEALKRFPAVNASIDGNDMVYHGYQDIGVAVSSDKGLVVPVLRNVENMGLADIEAGIAAYGRKARDGKLSIEEMTGGTFTISNGGVFGSLMSTPILNPPQTAILGMHKIQERPMAVNGEVKILPMMYLALSYDHRMIDGREAVQFLVTIKDLLEDPARILLQV